MTTEYRDGRCKAQTGQPYAASGTGVPREQQTTTSATLRAVSEIVVLWIREITLRVAGGRRSIALPTPPNGPELASTSDAERLPAWSSGNDLHSLQTTIATTIDTEIEAAMVGLDAEYAALCGVLVTV